jgi:hypothetical protein
MRILRVLGLMLIVFFITGCGKSDKIERLENSLYNCEQSKSNLWDQRRSLQNEIYAIETKLEESNQKIKSFQQDQDFTQQMIKMLAIGESDKAMKIAKSIDQGWFDEIDRQVLSQNELINEIKRKSEIRKEAHISEEKEFHTFMIKAIILLLKGLVILVLASSFILVLFLIYKGEDIQDKLVRVLGVISFMILYFMASFHQLSISSLMLKTTFATSEIFMLLTRDIVPFFVGLIFAILIKKHIEKDRLFSSRWLIIVSTLLFCTLLDVFLNVKTELNSHDIPVANATFIVGLFMSLFFVIKPNKSEEPIKNPQAAS